MQTIDELIEALQRLSVEQRQRVRAELEALENGETTPEGGEAAPVGEYDSLLDLAGAGSSDHSDISSNKNKYLADASATKP